MLEPGALSQAKPAHHGLGGLVEYGGHRPDLVSAQTTERDAEGSGGCLGRIAVMPGAAGEPPAHFEAPGPRPPAPGTLSGTLSGIGLSPVKPMNSAGPAISRAHSP